MMKPYLTALFVCGLMCGFRPSGEVQKAAKPLHLTTGGKTEFVILAETDGNAEIALAVKELKDYLKSATGVEFPVKNTDKASDFAHRIIVGSNPISQQILGKNEIDSLKPEESLVVVKGDDLILVGGTPRGTLYAVYSFLENEVDCRWFNAYGDQSVPKRDSLVISDVSRREKPTFQHRYMQEYFYAKQQGKEDFFRRNRMNGNGSGIPLDFPAIGPSVHTSLFYINPGHDFSEWGIRPPQSDFFASHPEFFTMTESGTRVDDHQLCFSNVEMRKVFTDQVMKTIAASPDKSNGVVNVSAKDVPGPLCHCPSCVSLVKKYETPVGPLIDYIIELCGELKKAYPGVYVDTLAYRKDQSEVPPKIEALPDNLIITFAPIDDNFAVTLDHPDNQKTLKHLQEWCKMAKNVRLWYYPNTYGTIGYEPPSGILQRLTKDAQLISEAGATGTYYQHDAGGVTTGYNFSELQTWLLVKLFQNPYQDKDKLVREFTDFYYGAAAPVMRQYIDELENLRLTMTTPLPWNATLAMYSYLTPDRIATWEAMFDYMEGLPGLSQLQSENIRTVRVTLDLMMLDKWKEMVAASPEMKLTLQQLIGRIRDGQKIATGKRYPSVPDSAPFEKIIANMELKATVDPKPLPEQFDFLPPDSVKRIYPFEVAPNREKDTDAAAGVALAKEGTREDSFDVGIYDNIGKKILLTTSIERIAIIPDVYRLYKVGRSVLTPNCLFWAAGWGDCISFG